MISVHESLDVRKTLETRVTYVKWLTVEFSVIRRMRGESMYAGACSRARKLRAEDRRSRSNRGGSLFVQGISRTETSRGALEHVTRRDVVPSPRFLLLDPSSA